MNNRKLYSLMDQIPRPLIVIFVLAAGIATFFFIKEPASLCNSQIEIFKQSQAGAIFPRVMKSAQRPALYPRLVDNCKTGNSPGACYELFSLLRKLNQDLRGSPQECLVPFGEIPQVKKALTEGVQLMIQLAWGEKPPEEGLSKFHWMETSDLALYCQLRDLNFKIYGDEAWTLLRKSTYAKLPGEAQIFQDGQCVNCETIKSAPQALSEEEIWVRSLFSLRCEQFL